MHKVTSPRRKPSRRMEWMRRVVRTAPVASRRIVMYYHGLEDVGTQVSRVATSRNGIEFEAQPEILGPCYMRIFSHHGMTYALTMPGPFYRSKDGLHGFEPGPH
jgi:hypothetical protein